jgi:predicted DNA-binding WGR domain protein
MAQYVYLENTSGIHNKFYEMFETTGNKWTAHWGIIGKVGGQTKNYSMTEWYNKYNEKIKKGYVDKTYFNNPQLGVDSEHLAKVDKIMLILTSHATEIQNSIELIRGVSSIKIMLNDKNSKNKGKLGANDMGYLNKVWKKIKHLDDKR